MIINILNYLMTYKLVSSYELTYKTLSYCTTLRRRSQVKNRFTFK